MRVRPDHYIWYYCPYYKRPEINLGKLYTKKEVSDTLYQRDTKKLRETNSPRQQARKKDTRISALLRKSNDGEKKKLENQQRERLRGMRENLKADRDSKLDSARQNFFDDRINKPGLIGKKEYRWREE